MRPALLLLVLPAVVASFSAGQPALSSVCNSAPAPNQPVLVNADCRFAPPSPPLPADTRLFYSLDDQSSWQELTMQRIGQPGYDSTWEAAFVAPSSGAVRYYVRAADNSGYATQSPFNASNALPPAGSSTCVDCPPASTSPAFPPPAGP